MGHGLGHGFQPLSMLGGAGKQLTHQGQKYFNIALVLEDELLTIFTHPANTCTRP